MSLGKYLVPATAVASVSACVYVCHSQSSKETCPELVQEALYLFQKHFGVDAKHAKGKMVAASAPGRVNLIGEHTDYSDGFVFPMAIDRMAVVVGRANGLDKYRLVSTQGKVVSLTKAELLALPVGRPTWDCYVRGVVAQYAKKGLQVPPFDAAIAGNVPLGGGLSSSAALEVATATFLDALLNINTPARDRALMSQKAEHEYAKMPCGVMDQFISAFGQAGKAMLLDCRSLKPKLVKLSDPNVVVLITNSNVKHELNTGEYAVRRKQCEAAVKALQQIKPGAKALRDADVSDLKALKSKVDPVVYKRARHVITENARCLKAAKALEDGDLKTMGELMNASHDSLQKDFEVSCDEIDILVKIARAQPGVYGSRITGGGFGGCTVTLVEKSKVAAVQAALQKKYRAKVGKKCTCMVSVASDGAKVVKLEKLRCKL